MVKIDTPSTENGTNPSFALLKKIGLLALTKPNVFFFLSIF